MDLFSISKEMIALMREKQIEAAAERVRIALRICNEKIFTEQSKKITVINRNIQFIKKQNKKLWELANALPQEERIFVEHQIKEVINQIYTDELCRLKAEKRRYSKPIS